MPFEVKMSQFASRAIFEQEVVNHIARLLTFNREVGKPRPVAHPLIEASVRRVPRLNAPDNYVPDYVIIDDTPPEVKVQGMSLDDKKHQLHAQLAHAENEAKHKMLPRRKMRLAAVKMSLASMTPEDKRTAEQNEDIASYLQIQKAWQRYDLIAAQAESDLDDLTEDTVDSWQLPTFG